MRAAAQNTTMKHNQTNRFIVFGSRTIKVHCENGRAFLQPFPRTIPVTSRDKLFSYLPAPPLVCSLSLVLLPPFYELSAQTMGLGSIYSILGKATHPDLICCNESRGLVVLPLLSRRCIKKPVWLSTWQQCSSCDFAHLTHPSATETLADHLAVTSEEPTLARQSIEAPLSHPKDGGADCASVMSPNTMTGLTDRDEALSGQRTRSLIEYVILHLTVQ